MLPRLIILAAVMLGIGLAVCMGIVLIMARMLVRPPRMTDLRAMLFLHRLSPGDLGFPYETISFSVIDQRSGQKLHVAAWWIPAAEPSTKCALLVHGYSDAKVGAIAWAPMLRSFGLNILAIDLRAHGESGGEYSCAGFWERHDVNQVIDQIRCERPGQTKKMILFGISLGAATCAAAAALRDDLAAVVLEAPYADFHIAATLQADRLGTPGPFFQDWAYRLGKWMCKADFDAVKPIDTIPKISCPVMVIQSGDDPFLTEACHASMHKAVKSRSAAGGVAVCWDIPCAHHCIGMLLDPVEYRSRIQEFLSKALQKDSEVCEK